MIYKEYLSIAAAENFPQKLRFKRKKPRHLLLSICYRLAKLQWTSANKKLGFFLDLNWITWRLAIEEADHVYGFGDHSLRRKNLAFLLDRIEPQSIVLDLGCRHGEISSFLAEKADRVIGVDHDFQAIEKAKASFTAHNLEFIHGDAFEVLARERDTVDTVVLSHILEHLEDPSDMLRRLRGRTKNCYIELPDLDASYLNHYRIQQKSKLLYTDDDHIWEFDRDALKKVIDDAGWEILESEYRYGVQKHWCKTKKI